MALVAGVDSSTQSCKVVIKDADTGALVRSGRASHPDGTSVDPAAWWSALQTAIADAGGLEDVAAISIAAQQHGMVVLDRDGRVIRDALLWNDTRSADAAAALIAEVGAADYAQRTGSVPVASFTATKLRWLRDAEPEHAARVAAVALPHDWLSWRLRGYGPADESPLGPDLSQLATDRSDASGTSYFGPNGYDLALFERALGKPGIEATPGSTSDAVILPRVLGPGEAMGTTVAQPAAGIPAGLIVGPGAGDNAGAALGLGADTGDIVVSIGTSGTVFAVTSSPTADTTGAVAGFADASGQSLPLVATLNAARVLDAMTRLLGVDHITLGTLALEAPAGADGAVLVPYFEGERTPNLPEAKATLHGLTLANTRPAHIARAAIEGMLCALADGLDAVRRLGVTAGRILLIGGAAQNEAVQQIAAQVFDVPVVIPSPGEYVADGAAVQAAWVLHGSRPSWQVATVATPAPNTQPQIREAYRAAVQAAHPELG